MRACLKYHSREPTSAYINGPQPLGGKCTVPPHPHPHPPWVHLWSTVRKNSGTFRPKFFIRSTCAAAASKVTWWLHIKFALTNATKKRKKERKIKETHTQTLNLTTYWRGCTSSAWQSIVLCSQSDILHFFDVWQPLSVADAGPIHHVTLKRKPGHSWSGRSLACLQPTGMHCLHSENDLLRQDTQKTWKQKCYS